MSEPTSSSGADSPRGPLQFDTAEYATPPESMRCTTCQQLIEREYYQANDTVICGPCRALLDASRQTGTGTTRFARAVAAGTAAAIAGALLYLGVAKITGYEFGLIAIVVGFAVGAAVRWGCYGRGGPLYQTLAIVLTYLSIAGTNVPGIIEAIRASQKAEVAAVAETSETAPQAAHLRPAASATPTAADEGAPSLIGFVLAMVFVMALAVAAPFLAGLENIIGIIIIGVGVYEAWKINKRAVMIITGPHAVAAPLTTAGPIVAP